MSKLIDIKMFVRPRNRDGERITINGNSYSYTQEAGHAAKADKAKEAEKSTFSEHAQYADHSYTSRRAYYADKAQDLVEDSEFFDFLKTNYLSKVSPDEAKGAITFLKGIILGKNYSIDEDGNARLSSVDVGEFKEGLSGGVIKMKDGKSYLEVDQAYFRQKAVFESLELMKIQFSYGNRIVGKGGIKATRVEERANAYRCYFQTEQDGLKISNPFVVKDLAIAKEFNIKEGTTEHAANHYLWRAVTAVGEGYVDLSKTDCDTGSDAPLAGDSLCQLGYKGTGRPDRQCAIMEKTVGDNAPAYVMLQGINDFSLDGKDMLSFGWDNQKKRAHLCVYGDAYVGDRERSQYIEYTPDGGLVVKAKEVLLYADGAETNLGEQIKEAPVPRNMLRGTAFRFVSEIPQNSKEHPATLSPDTYKGTGVVDININGSSDVFSGIKYDHIRGVAGKRLTLSFMTKIIAAPDTMGIEVKAYKDEWVPSAIKFRLAEYQVPEKSGWQLHTLSFDVPGDTAYLDIPMYIVKAGHVLLTRPMLEEGDKYTGWTPSPLDDVEVVKRCGVNINAERIELDGKTVFKNGNAPEVPLFGADGKVNANLSSAQYLVEALKSMKTVIDGGLVMAGLIASKDVDGNVTSYLNGLRQKMYALAAGVKNFGKADETSVSHIGFDGSAQFGSLGIAYDGRVSIVDEEGKPRINATPKELPSDGELLKAADTDITQALPDMHTAEAHWENEIKGGVFTTVNDNSYVVLAGRITAGAYTDESSPDGTVATLPVAALKLHNTMTNVEINLDCWAFAGVKSSPGIFEHMSESREFSCARILPVGRWQLVATAYKGDNTHGQLIHFGSLRVNISHKSGKQALSLAGNGWSVVKSEKQAAYVRDGKLYAVGEMNIPGILLAGTVSRYGQLSNAWGEFAAGTTLQYTSSGGVQVMRLTFNKALPCGANYVAIVNPNDSLSPYGCMAVVRHKTETYCDFRVVNDSGGEVTGAGLDFMIIGRNK